jgi:hypothetical protein
MLLALLCTPVAWSQAINCPVGTGFNFNTSGACSVAPGGYIDGSQAFNYRPDSGALSGTSLVLVPADAGHQAWSIVSSSQFNVQAFTETATFVPNGFNMAFVWQNDTSYPAINFANGAGGEGGFSQFAGVPNLPPTNVVGLQLDQYNPITQSGSFTYSSAQLYQTLQDPNLPVVVQAGYLALYPTTKISTYPVPLNDPANSSATTTGDTYSATIVYDGWNLTFSMYDITAGGSCPGATCFTNTWSGVNIPAVVGNTVARPTITAGTSLGTGPALLLNSWVYTVNTPTGTPSYTAWNANSTYNIGTSSAASPVYSLAPGTYSGAQSVSITTSTSPNNYVCYVLSNTVPTLYPQPDNNGGCAAGTLYSSPVSISSTSTLYAMAGSSNQAFGTGVVSPAGLGPPSTLVAGTYTISGSSAVTPTFSPVAGTYTGAQTITISTSSSGAVICYNTTGSPHTNGSTGCTTGTLYTSPVVVSSGLVLYAVAGGTGFTDSSVGSAAYVINTGAATPTFSPVAGSYPGGQTVTISTTSGGAIICYNTTGSPHTNGTTGCSAGTLYSTPVAVNSSETLYAVAGGTGFTDSSPGSAAYTISVAPPAVFSGKLTLAGHMTSQ